MLLDVTGTTGIQQVNDCMIVHGPVSLHWHLCEDDSFQRRGYRHDPVLARWFNADLVLGLPSDLEALRIKTAPSALAAIRDALHAAGLSLTYGAVVWLANGEHSRAAYQLFHALTGVMPPWCANCNPDELPALTLKDIACCRKLLESDGSLLASFATLPDDSPWSGMAASWRLLAQTMDAEAPGWREGAALKRCHRSRLLLDLLLPAGTASARRHSLALS